MIFGALCSTFLGLLLLFAAHLEAYERDGFFGHEDYGHTDATNLSHILNKGIQALGGRSNLATLNGVTSHA